MIDREQVIHVARLARLGLEEDEIAGLSVELSGILDHFERLSEVDLEGVEPTTHVVPLENVLRDDVPRPELGASRATEQAPDAVDDAFCVPSPQTDS